MAQSDLETIFERWYLERFLHLKILISSDKNHPLVIRPPMCQNITHLPNGFSFYAFIMEVYFSADSTHRVLSKFSIRNLQ